MSQTFCVFLTTPELPPLMDIAKPFAQFRNTLVPDAALALKPHSGLIEENLDEGEARRLSDLFTAAGFPNAVLASEKQAPLMSAHTISSVQLADNGLLVSVQPNAWQRIPWSAFCLLAAAVFKETTLHITKTEQGPSAQEKLLKAGILLTTGLPLPMSKKKTIQTKTEETNLHCYLDLFLKKPEMRLRLDGQKLDYQCLGEKMAVGAQENFRTLLREIVAHAVGVRQNTTFAHIVATPPKGQMYQESEKEFDRECRWRLTQQRWA